MGSDGIFQFKQPLFLPNRSPAQKDFRFNACKLNFPAADNLINIHTQKGMVLRLHSQAQRLDIPIGAAHGYYIYRRIALFHTAHPFLSIL